MGIFSNAPRKSQSAQGVITEHNGPVHIAIIMDGNGRWARQRLLPRVAGHKRGVETVREVVKACAQSGVKYLTLFAFSSENWRRPPDEVSFLMGLFSRALAHEVDALHRNQIRLKVVGDRSALAPEIVDAIDAAELKTANNQALTLTLCVNYGGRWDISQACEKILSESAKLAPQVLPDFSPDNIGEHLALAYAPEPDLFIRTGGEQRISNFMLWQLAYTELYFTDVLWPDFNAQELQRAIESFAQRERRFGRTSEQVAAISKATAA